MPKADRYTREAMPAHVWAALVWALERARRGDPREWYRLLRRYCGYTTGSPMGAVMEMRIDASMHDNNP